MNNIEEILLSETSNIEFKEDPEISKPKSWLKTVSAFANSIGGCIYWGICDNRSIKGVSNTQLIIEKISELIKVKIEPMLLFRIETIVFNNKNIIQLEIKAGTSTPYYYVNDGSKIAFIRMGNESVIAPTHVLNELILKGQRLSYDTMSSKLKITDVSFTLFEATYKQRTRTVVDKTSDYLSFGLVDEAGILTNAGVLLSDQCPILQSRVFCTRWNGTDKGSIFEDAIDDKEFNGNLISLLDNTLSFVKNNSKVKWKKTSTGRDEMPDYPERAVFESVVNSLIHRDYMILGSEIHVDMYDDRLVITSPGGMFDGKKIQEIDILQVPSSIRNPIISDVFHRLKYMECRGSGIKKILKEYESESIPEFYSDQHYFIVKLKNKNYNEIDKIINKDEIQLLVKENYSEKSSEKIINIMKKNKNITISEIANIIGISQRAIEKQISKLKEAGRIKRIGSDKSGYWEIV